jgi:hypothetical protein
MTTEHEAARAALAGLGIHVAGDIGEEYFSAESEQNVAALVAFARRAKAEALREAIDVVAGAPLFEEPGYEEDHAPDTRENCVAAIRALAAKLTEAP